jgi:hypothetical protein
MMRILLLAFAMLSFIVPGVPVVAAAPAQTPSQVTVTLAPVRGSHQRGMATLTQRGNELIVTIHMPPSQGAKMPESGSPMMTKTGPLAAHIHRGRCPNPSKTPLYPLNPVTKGTSTTTLTSTTLSKLTSGDYTVSVHKSEHDTTNPIACGDITLANPTGTTQ